MPYIVSQRTAHIHPPHGEAVLDFPFGIDEYPADLAAKLMTIEQFYHAGTPIVTESLNRGEPCCVAIIDVDRLQRVAELHGVECAQAVLAAFADILVGIAEDTHMTVGHLEADQFGLLLTGQGGAEALASFDSIREELSTRTLSWNDLSFGLTVSIGVAEIHGPETFDNYLNAAEQFLFMAKSYGRDRVMSDHSFAAMH